MKPLIFQVHTVTIDRKRNVKLKAVSVPFATLKEAWTFADRCWDCSAVVVEFTDEQAHTIDSVHTHEKA